MSSLFKFIYVTASSEGEAREIALEVVSKDLAACANIVPGMRSVYRWEGEVVEGEECVLILKTSAALEEACIVAVTGMHSYDCPCVVSLDIARGHPDFLEWLGSFGTT